MRIKNVNYFANMILSRTPFAKAEIMGGPLASNINGTVSFYPAHNGTLVVAEVYNLPRAVPASPQNPPIGPFGFHIHEGSTCEVGNPADPFQAAGGHYNPTGMPHPEHAGDLPVLLSDNGYAFMIVFTDRFVPQQVLGRTIMIHQSPDDFRTQPAGNSGKRLACGVIRAFG